MVGGKDCGRRAEEEEAATEERGGGLFWTERIFQSWVFQDVSFNQASPMAKAEKDLKKRISSWLNENLAETTLTLMAKLFSCSGPEFI